ncbi:MAG: universal stress protein [Planctomycetes bacterium]|nr:universal stress protein [Planctomycetota bacterium]
MKLERILVGCALGEGEDEVLQAAGDVARIYGSRVLPVHVLGADGILAPSGRESESFARERMNALAERARKEGLEVEPPQLLRGKAAAALLEHAERWRASWIVVGAAARTGWERLLGSSAETLCRESKIPTLLVPPGGRPTWKKLLCAVDGSDPALAALTVASEMARTFTAHLTLLYVQTDGEAHRKAADEVMESLGLHEVEVDVITRSGSSVPEVIAAAQQETSADVLVLGTAGRTGLERILRPNTAESLLRRLPCALLVAPAAAED